MNSFYKIIKSSGPKGVVFNISRLLQTETKRTVAPIVLKLANVENSWIWQKNDKIQSPIINKINKIDLPNGLSWVPPPLVDPTSDKVIEAPSTPSSDITKEAVRMIVIRRKKMKKHKLKKLRKRLRFYRAKIRQRREWQKEKDFQAELISQCKTGEAFSAEEYVNNRLAKLKELTSSQDIEPRFGFVSERNRRFHD